MEVTWRGAEYEFHPKTIEGGGDNYTRYSNIDGLIFGADTESVQLTDRYEVQCFTLSSSTGDHLEYVPSFDRTLETFLHFFLTTYDEKLFNHVVNHHFVYWHNLEYDWLQLVKNDSKLLELAKIGVSPSTDLELFKLGDYKITMKKNSLFSGSAPHVKFKVRKGRKNITLYFFDTFSFFPSSLSKLAKDLSLDVEKMERQEDLGKTDYREQEENEDKTYFETYAMIDSKVTRLAGERIRELHQQAGMTKIRPSSPAYAINLLYHGMTEEQSIRTGVYDKEIMQLILDSYRGGRTGGIVHGKVEGVSVLDFHSSYPASMLSLPSFSPSMEYIPLEGESLELENVVEILKETGNAFLLISGTETDSHYPSLLTTVKGKLTPIYGEFERIATTGYEFLVGVMSGSLKDITIHECVVLLDMEDEPFLPFREFAQTNYERKKNSEKGSVEYASSKLALNSAYGKLIESRTQTLIGASDSRNFLPYIEGMEKEFGNYYYTKYVEAIEEGKIMSDIYSDLLEELTENFDEDTLSDMNHKMFGDFTISGRIYGRYVIPAGASLITGCSRARLLVAMKCLTAFYWDTDSVFVPFSDEETVNELLEGGKDWIPKNAVPVRVGEELGELDFEMVDGSGYLAGVKRYYLEDHEGRTKQATHGIPALPREKTKDVIHSLSTGKNFSYDSKPRPQKAKESKRVEDIGSFQIGHYESRFHLDDRLEWTETETGWIGTLREYENQGTSILSHEKYENHMKKLYSDMSYDVIKEQIKIHGFIECPTKGDYYWEDYKRLPQGIKRKYFRRNKGLPIDVWSTSTGIDIHELFKKLEG